MAKIIPKETIEQIRSGCDVVDVIGSYINVQRSGTTYKALCPFHKEKTPSFHVNPQRQIFHCFGCGAGGDVFKFVMQYENVDFVTAAKMLGERVGVRIELETAEEKTSGISKDSLYKLHEELAQFYHRILMENEAGKIARNYLQQRQLDPDTVKNFLIGFAPDRPNVLASWAQKNGFTPEHLEAAGLIIIDEEKRKSGNYYERFRNRLMFPIRDELGRAIAFSGRILEKNDKIAKYVNSPETLLFRKSRTLYAIDRARKNILETRTAILCEGQIDVIRCHSAGLPTAIAALGTAVTEEHVRLIRRYADAVILVMDADTAGQNSAMRTAEIFLSQGVSVKVASLPPGEDPDSLILHKGADALAPFLQQAKSAVDFQIDVLLAREGTPSESGLMRVAKAVTATIGKATTAVHQDQLIKQAAARLQLSENALREDLRRGVTRPPATRPTDEKTKKDLPPHPVEELDLIKLLVHFPDCTELIKTHLPLHYLIDPDCRILLERLFEISPDMAQLITVLDNDGEECHRLAAEILAADKKVTMNENQHVEAAQDLILTIWRRRLTAQRKKLEQERLTATGPKHTELDLQLKQLILDINLLRQGWKKALPLLELGHEIGS